MTAQTQKTIRSAAIIAVVLFIAWKIWPTVKRALNSVGIGGSAGAGSGGGVAASQYPEYPDYAQTSANKPGSGISFGGASGAGLGAGSGAGSGGGLTAGYGAEAVYGAGLGEWITEALSFPTADPDAYNYLSSIYEDYSNVSDNPPGSPTSITLEPVGNFDVNQLAYPVDQGGYDPGAYDGPNSNNDGSTQYEPYLDQSAY